MTDDDKESYMERFTDPVRFRMVRDELPESLQAFIEDAVWIFAKTYADTWPHEYIVEEKVDGRSFSDLAGHIDKYGYESDFYSTKQTYYDHGGNTYWHMGNIINRCPTSETYSRRKAEGRLPEDLSDQQGKGKKS